jgi:hypothetical protein
VNPPILQYNGIVKTVKSSTPSAFRFNTLGLVTIPIANLSDGVANTTVQGRVVLPQPCKISKVGFTCTSIDALTGDSFNIVMGEGSYTQGDVAPPDNSLTYGYPTAFAANGDALFAADVVLNATNIPGLTVDDGGSGVLVPYQRTYPGSSGTWGPAGTAANPTFGTLLAGSYDSIFPAGADLTVRFTTNASTGAIDGIAISLLLEPIDPAPDFTEGIPGLYW